MISLPSMIFHIFYSQLYLNKAGGEEGMMDPDDWEGIILSWIPIAGFLFKT